MEGAQLVAFLIVQSRRRRRDCIRGDLLLVPIGPPALLTHIYLWIVDGGSLMVQCSVMVDASQFENCLKLFLLGSSGSRNYQNARSTSTRSF